MRKKSSTEGTVPQNDSSEMGFFDHLEELRWRIIYSLLGIVVGAILVWFFKDFIMDGILLRPAVQNKLHLQNLRPFGQVMLYMEVAVFGGILLSIPNIFYQIWKFIAPGLYKHERKHVKWIIIFTSLCFLLGVTFAYIVILPAAFVFSVNFGSRAIENNIAVDHYFEFIIMLMLGSGLVFELPMVSFFLSKLGLLSPKFMRKYWRHAIVIIFFLAAILSPGPDPISMLLLAIPLVMLYEISIWISKVAYKKKSRPEEPESPGEHQPPEGAE
jgi:sec-independent protein translocase protein TatC